MKRIYTLDNGGAAFMVELEGNQARVYEGNERMLELEEKEDPRKPECFTIKRLTRKFREAHIGRDLDQRCASCRKPNSVLLRVGAREYVHIGFNVLQFRMFEGDTFEEYVGRIGNSAVLYPWVRGRYYYYLLTAAGKTDWEAIPRQYAAVKPRLDDLDPGPLDPYQTAWFGPEIPKGAGEHFQVTIPIPDCRILVEKPRYPLRPRRRASGEDVQERGKKKRAPNREKD